MAPEHPPSLVIFDARFEEDDLKGVIEYVEVPIPDQLRVRWDVSSRPEGYRPVGNGVAYIRDKAGVTILPASADATPDHLGNSRYRWTEGMQFGRPWLMFVLVLPAGFTLVDPVPGPARAKVFDGRVAVYWFLKADEAGRTSVECTLQRFDTGISEEVERINGTYTTGKVSSSSSIRIEDKQPNPKRGSGTGTPVAVAGDMTPQLYFTVGLGVFFLLLVIVLVVWIEEPTDEQMLVFRVTMALAAAAIGAIIPGFLHIEGDLPNVMWRAGGAIALFVLVFQLDPPTRIQTPPERATQYVLYGKVHERGDPRREIANARVSLELERTREVTTDPKGEFSFGYSASDVNKTAILWAEAPDGYTPSEVQKLPLLSSMDKVYLEVERLQPTPALAATILPASTNPIQNIGAGKQDTIATASEDTLPNNQTVVRSFWLNYDFEPKPGKRNWKLLADSLWIETYPDGTYTEFTPKERTEIDGCKGWTVINVHQQNFEVFIPDDGCPLMWLRFRVNSGEWTFFAEMRTQ